MTGGDINFGSALHCDLNVVAGQILVAVAPEEAGELAVHLPSTDLRQVDLVEPGFRRVWARRCGG